MRWAGLAISAAILAGMIILLSGTTSRDALVVTGSAPVPAATGALTS